jgi:hypothetical protein
VGWWKIACPVVGIVVAAGTPLVRYAVMERHEHTALGVLRTITDAQRAYERRTGGYATDASSLLSGCNGSSVLAGESLTTLDVAGYVLQLRAADDAAVLGHDCQGRSIASDYYVAVAPRSASGPAREAFAARSDGQVYVFVDGIPPREEDLKTGLPIPLDRRESFKIP